MTIAIMPDTHYVGICDTVREKTGLVGLLKSAEVAPAIRSIELGGTSLMLTVTTKAGATVTATKGHLSVSAVATNGTAVLALTEAGDWTVRAAFNDETSTVVVSVADRYGLSLLYPVFANNSWADIIKACQLGIVPATWVVGDQKAMVINGTEYLIDIIGKGHDDYADGSGKAPLTLQLHDCYDNKGQMNTSITNVGGWASCAMRKTYLPAVLALMPSEVQAAIKEVNKLTSEGNKSETINTTADKLFLLSQVEVSGEMDMMLSKAGEGKQYKYYAAGNSNIKYYDGSPCDWWFRSPDGTSTRAFCFKMTGIYYGSASASETAGVSFAFCF